MPRLADLPDPSKVMKSSILTNRRVDYNFQEQLELKLLKKEKQRQGRKSPSGRGSSLTAREE